MNGKLSKETVISVKRNFVDRNSWLKIRTKKKDLHCSHCGVPHANSLEDIALAMVKGKVNAHLCLDCAEFFISTGSKDVDLQVAKNKARKDKLIKQAKRLGHIFVTYFDQRDADKYSTDELEGIIKRRIIERRKTLHSFLKLPPETKYLLTKMTGDYHKTAFDIFKDRWDFFSTFSREISRDACNDLDFLEVEKDINGVNYGWIWATSRNPNFDIKDSGFEFDFNSIHVVDETKKVSDKMVLEHILSFYLGKVHPEEQEAFLRGVKKRLVNELHS